MNGLEQIFSTRVLEQGDAFESGMPGARFLVDIAIPIEADAVLLYFIEQNLHGAYFLSRLKQDYV